jgi:hypothetical protein
VTFLLFFCFTALAFSPLQLGAQDAEEAVGPVAEKTDGCLGALAVDVVVEPELYCLLPIYCEVDLVGDAYDLDAYGGVSRDDDGTDGEQVRTDGSDQHGVDTGHDDGAVGGEVVGGGAGGGGDDDAVGAEGGDGLLVDLDGEVAHAGDGAFGDDDVVEGVPLLDDLAVADDGGAHHAADFDLGAVVAPGFEGGVELGEGDLGEEAEGAEVDAEDGGGGAGEGAGCGEEGTVATEDDDEVGLVCWEIDAGDGVGAFNVGGAVGVEEIVVVASFEPRDEVAKDTGKFRLLRLGDDGGL